MPLPDALQRVGDRIVDFFANPGGEAPYLLYVYAPTDEFAVRRELGDLRQWLEAAERGVACRPVALADLFWQALEEAGWLESLIEEERRAADDPAALQEIYQAVGDILRQPPTLPDRVIAALDDPTGEDGVGRSAAFLYRAGALYPAYRTSGLLEDLHGRLRRPVTLLYPGRLVGSYGLRFMDRCEPAFGYRATIIPRGGGA